MPNNILFSSLSSRKLLNSMTNFMFKDNIRILPLFLFCTNYVQNMIDYSEDFQLDFGQ